MPNTRRSSRLAQRTTINQFLNFPRRNVINLTQSPNAEESDVSFQEVSLDVSLEDVSSQGFNDLQSEDSEDELVLEDEDDNNPADLNVLVNPMQNEPMEAAQITNLNTELNISNDDFKIPNVLKENKSLSKDISTISNESMDDSENCMICMESWSNSGSHRLVSLKCGHLFGNSCIEKWLGKLANGRCPQCNTKASQKDIRIIFARSIKVIDTTDRDRLARELEKERVERQIAEREAARMRLNAELASAQYESMKKQMLELQRINLILGSKKNVLLDEMVLTQASHNGEFSIERNIIISTKGGCRVLTLNKELSLICVSQPTSSDVNPGFGIKKIKIHDLKACEYVPVHSKPIRDVAFSSERSNQLLLSCSMDKTIKLTNLNSNVVVQSFECVAPVWSCVWSTDDPVKFYGGLQNGSVICCDIRKLSEVLPFPAGTSLSRSPVVSLKYQPSNQSVMLSGLVVGQLDHCSFVLRENASSFVAHNLALEGNLTSLSIESSSSHLLRSLRPSVAYPNTRHQLLELCWSSSVDMDGQLKQSLSKNLMQTVVGGSFQKLLSRSLLMQHPQYGPKQLLICSGDEASQSVKIWNSSSGKLEQSILLNDQTIDLANLSSSVADSPNLLFALTDSQLTVLKWVQ